MKIQLKNSSVYQNGAAFPPTASQMADGEIAVNFNAQDPAIFLKDSNENIVRIAGKDSQGTTDIVTVVPIQAAAPATPDTGHLYFDTDDNRLYIYDGSSWLDASQEQFNINLIPDATNPSSQGGTLDDRYALKNGNSLSGDTFSGHLTLAAGLTVNASDIYLNNGKLIFEGTSNDAFDTEVIVVDPTQNNVISIPDTSGNLVTTGDLGTVTSAMIADGSIVDADINSSASISLSKISTGSLPTGITVESANIVDGTIVNSDISSSAAIDLTKLANGSLPAGITVGSANLAGGGISASDLNAGALPADVTVASTNIVDGSILDVDISTSAKINVSKLADGTPGQLIQTDLAGTGVEWTSNINLPGTLDVTGIATFDNNVVVNGNLTVTGSSISLDANIVNIKDTNIQLGVVSSPSNSTANGGGITLKAAIDKTFNWIATTNAWTANANIDLASGQAYYINTSLILSASTLGSSVINSSLTSVGTITSGIWNGTPIASEFLGTLTNTGQVANSATTATDLNSPNAIVSRDGSGDFSARNITAALIGNATTATSAATADKLTTPRVINLFGDVTGSASFDGSGDIVISCQVVGGVGGGGGGSGGGPTNLSYWAPTRELASSSGNNVILPEVVASGDSGFMTGTDKAKLDGIISGAQVQSVNGQTGAVQVDVFNKTLLSNTVSSVTNPPTTTFTVETGHIGTTYFVDDGDPNPIEVNIWPNWDQSMSGSYTPTSEWDALGALLTSNNPPYGTSITLPGYNFTVTLIENTSGNVNTPQYFSSSGRILFHCERDYININPSTSYINYGAGAQFIAVSGNWAVSVATGPVFDAQKSTSVTIDGTTYNSSDFVLSGAGNKDAEYTGTNSHLLPSGLAIGDAIAQSGIVSWHGDLSHYNTFLANTFEVNCENNVHGVKIKAPAHSAAATYTLTLPTSLPTIAGQVLSSDLDGDLAFATVDAAYVETPKTVTLDKNVDTNINALIVGPTVEITSGTVIAVGSNSHLTVVT